MWRTDLYIAEASRQLADQRFYQKIPSDATQSPEQEVKTFIDTAIENNQLPPPEPLAVYLDHVTDSYVKDTTHMLNILDSFRFSDVDRQRLVFTMDIKSLYTVIPNDEGLRELQHYLDMREVLEPSTDTLLRMSELVFTLNTFEFNGELYKQTGGAAMGSRLGPNYACLFVGFVE